MAQAKLYYKAVMLPLAHFLILFYLKTPLDHGTPWTPVQVSGVLNKERDKEKGKDEGSRTGRQQPCAYSELDKGFIATNCSILEQSLGHSFLVTAGVPRTPSNYICFLRKSVPEGSVPWRLPQSLCLPSVTVPGCKHSSLAALRQR